MIPLTARGRDLLAYIRNCPVCPTFGEMRRALGVVSKGDVTRLLRQLEERGHIRRTPFSHRAIVLLGPRAVPMATPYPFRGHKRCSEWSEAA